MRIKRIEEFMLEEALLEEIRDLLQACFPQYPSGQAYLGQVPHFRILAFSESGLLAGHLAVDFRMVNDNGTLVSVFGISDLCVHPEMRRQGIGLSLLRYLEILGQEHQVDFLVLIAADQEWYVQQGFIPVDGRFKWLMIRDAQSFGIMSRQLNHALMVKALGAVAWIPGRVDFLGTIF